MTRKTSFIKLKLLSAFILFCLLPILAISINNYFQIKRQITTLALNELDAIAEIKADQIDRYFKRLDTDITFIQHDPYIQNILENPFINQKKNRDHFKRFYNNRNIRQLYLLDMHSNVIMSDNLNFYQLNQFLKQISKNTSAKYFSDLYKSEHNQKDYLFLVSVPIKDENNIQTGILIAEVVANSIFDQIQNRIGLGETGETQLAKKIGNEVLFLNPLLKDPDAPLKRKVTIGSNSGLPIQSSSTGHIGRGASIDYLGHKVLASWRFIEAPHWGIVVKINQNEIYSVMDDNLYSIIISSVIILIFGIAASLSVASNLMRPINELDDTAHIDVLTRLANRRLLMDTLELSIKKIKVNSDAKLVVLFLDLDGFKAVNDTYGHEIGDWLLKTVAQRLRHTMRASDLIARLGGDEFVIVLSHVKDDINISEIAEKIIQEINEPFIHEDKNIHVGTSIGINVCESLECSNGDDLVRKADEAMYLAKKSGKNRFCFADV